MAIQDRASRRRRRSLEIFGGGAPDDIVYGILERAPPPREPSLIAKLVERIGLGAEYLVLVRIPVNLNSDSD